MLMIKLTEEKAIYFSYAPEFLVITALSDTIKEKMRKKVWPGLADVLDCNKQYDIRF